MATATRLRAPSQTISVGEARERYGISDDLIYALFKEGKLRKYKLGRRTLIDPEELGQLLLASVK
jgi:excisionase family DNA binding protein